LLSMFEKEATGFDWGRIGIQNEGRSPASRTVIFSWGTGKKKTKRNAKSDLLRQLPKGHSKREKQL